MRVSVVGGTMVAEHFAEGPGSIAVAGPRRIKGNFMEIGFIHNSTLRRAEEIIAQKESRQRVVVFCMADQLR